MSVKTLLAGLLILVALAGFWMTRPTAPEGPAVEEAAEVELGPADGRDLPAQDTGRVAVGDVAPDFSLLSYAGDVVTLSDYRGQRNVVLSFYRGHW